MFLFCLDTRLGLSRVPTRVTRDAIPPSCFALKNQTFANPSPCHSFPEPPKCCITTLNMIYHNYNNHKHTKSTSIMHTYTQNTHKHNSNPTTELAHARTRNPTIPTPHSTLLHIPNTSQHENPLLHPLRVPKENSNTNTHNTSQHNTTPHTTQHLPKHNSPSLDSSKTRSHSSSTARLEFHLSSSK